MSLLALELPADLVLSIPWTWRSLAWGLRKGLIGRAVPVQAACRLLSENATLGSEVAELAGCSREDPEVENYVSRLAGQEFQNGADDGPWLYLVLQWILDNKDLFDDPLRVVEEVYAEFDYPASMSGFVRYMPSDDPDLGSEGNRNRLYARWRSFLDRERARLCQ